MPQRHGRLITLVILFAVVAAGLSACQLPFGPHVQLSGTVYGENIADREAGKSVPVPLRAMVSCNGSSTTADANGTYSLSVPKASAYACSATAPQYARVSVNIPGNADSFTLNFGPKLMGECDHGDAGNILLCSVVPPATATLRGTVTDASNDQALKSVAVQCWNAATDVISDKSRQFTTDTDALGNYILRNLPVGPMNCVGGTDQTVQRTTLTPGKTTTLDLPSCVRNCSPFRYHSGDVIHRLTAYLIFWLPSGRTFEPDGNSERYMKLMQQYFEDVGGTPFYNILTQYYDSNGGPIHNEVTLGGTYLDTQPYPKAGTTRAPLLDDDIVSEINRVATLKQGSWVVDDEHAIFLFTGYNVQECAGSSADDGCTFLHNVESDFCAYHSYVSNTFEAPGMNLYYAYIPDIDDCTHPPSAQSPNDDPIADAVISIVSHEQFETVSDPRMGGWYDSGTFEGEMADKCVNTFGPIGTDGGNVTLAHGHRYIVQQEWSLHDQACVLSLS
jgi:hypothetical protein